MRDFPPGLTDFTPGDSHRPWLSTPGRFLAWLVRIQGSVFWWVVLLSVMWLLPSAVTPWALGHAIDEGILARDMGALLRWAAVLAIFTVGGACIGWLHHTLTVRSWLIATYGTRELVQNKATELGHALGRHTPTGEVLAVAESDASQFGQFLEIANRVFGNVITYIVVAVIVLGTNLKLGIVVLAVAPLLAFTSGPLLRPLQRAQTAERSRNSELTSMATDIVAGLRILRGIGGEHTFGQNYTTQSQRVRSAGVRAGLWSGAIDAIGVLFSGIFVVVLMYLGSREVEAGTLSVGGLVAFLGYALFLIQPIRVFFEFAQKLILARVSAQKTIALLGHDSPWPDRPQVILDGEGQLIDDASGVVLAPGKLTMVVSADPTETAALADRLGRYLPGAQAVALDDGEDSVGAHARERRRERAQRRQRAVRADREAAAQQWGVTLGGVDLAQAPIGAVREKILVLDTTPAVFAGTLQAAIDPHGRLTRTQAEAALGAAGAYDVFDATPGGWQGHLDERGRGLSGGQRQRLVLARALAAAPEILVLVEPTSAVDAHTEAHIAAELPHFRAGATTLVITTSPLLLSRADIVVWLDAGKVAASGTHQELLGFPGYRGVVVRGESDTVPAGAGVTAEVRETGGNGDV